MATTGGDRDAPRVFHTTRWSLVRAAGDPAAPTARAALEELCAAYWFPVYAFVRRCGHDAHDAADLTQGFFARLVERREFTAADPERGRFRTYLRNGVRFFLSDAREKAGAQKRGGGKPLLSLDADDADARLTRARMDGDTPEAAFERAWALEVLDRALGAVRDQYAARGKEELFDTLRPALLGDDDASRAELAARLDTTVGALKVSIHRLRRAYRDRLRAEVAQTLDDEHEVQDELGRLLEALGGGSPAGSG